MSWLSSIISGPRDDNVSTKQLQARQVSKCPADFSAGARACSEGGVEIHLPLPVWFVVLAGHSRSRGLLIVLSLPRLCGFALLYSDARGSLVEDFR